ncbi:MAG: glycosyltransferase family 4 protein [Planctomycetota bacterium]|jgi:UDP-GlcNAc:undecaprenyl-phosphate GlcNAc-1-phosphate transferase
MIRLNLWLIVGAAIPSMLVCWAAAWLVRRWGPRWGLVDRPGQRKIHTTAMPTGGGLAIWLGIVLPFALGHLVLWMCPDVLGVRLPEFVAEHRSGLLEQSGRLWILLAGGTVLMVLGLVDDSRGLDWRIRLASQTLVAVVLVGCGWRLSLFLDLPLLTGTLSVLWIVGLVNSFNMLDNMDGLSAGVAAIAAAMLATVMLLAPDPVTNQPQLFVAGLLLVVVGSLVGFLWHNRPPARLFMGDAGSYLVGYLLAMATLSATFAFRDAPRHAILAPLCVLAVPLYDTASVVLIRLRSGRSLFTGDKSHFSHRLVELGMTEGQAVLTIYLATATCGLGALLLHQVKAAGACIILLLVACILLLVAILETAGRRRRSDGEKE